MPPEPGGPLPVVPRSRLLHRTDSPTPLSVSGARVCAKRRGAPPPPAAGTATRATPGHRRVSKQRCTDGARSAPKAPAGPGAQGVRVGPLPIRVWGRGGGAHVVARTSAALPTPPRPPDGSAGADPARPARATQARFAAAMLDGEKTVELRRYAVPADFLGEAGGLVWAGLRCSPRGAGGWCRRVAGAAGRAALLVSLGPRRAAHLWRPPPPPCQAGLCCCWRRPTAARGGQRCRLTCCPWTFQAYAWWARALHAHVGVRGGNGIQGQCTVVSRTWVWAGRHPPRLARGSRPPLH